jgi:hypothetical protein
MRTSAINDAAETGRVSYFVIRLDETEEQAPSKSIVLFSETFEGIGITEKRSHCLDRKYRHVVTVAVTDTDKFAFKNDVGVEVAGHYVGES